MLKTTKWAIKCFVIGMILGFYGSGLAGNVVEAVRTEKAPSIDGKLDEECWKAAKPVTTFFINNTTNPANFTTSAMVLYDANNLYIGIRCNEPDIANIKTRNVARGHGDVFRTDCIEIMLDPTASKNDYYHFGINASGSIYDRACTQGGYIGDEKWDADVTAASFIGDTFWSCEVVIPFSGLGISSKAKSIWNINICREKKSPSENSSIAEEGAFNIAGRFVELRGLDVDFNRFVYDVGAVHTDTTMRDGKMVAQLDVPIQNNTGKAGDVNLDCWLISPAGKTHVTSSRVNLPSGEKKNCLAGAFTLSEQGEYECAVQVSSAVTKKPLAVRKAKLKIQYVPLAINLIEPWYRNAIFETQEIKEVVLDVDLRIDPEKAKSITLDVAIREAKKDTLLDSRSITAPRDRNRVTFDAVKLPYGKLEIVAMVKDKSGKVTDETACPLLKLPYKKGEVWLGKDMRWRVDGKPFFLNGAWNNADGFFPDLNAVASTINAVNDKKFISCKILDSGLKMTQKSLGTNDIEKIRELVRKDKDAPNIFAYYLSDEPEGSGNIVTAMEQAYQTICDEDPYHPVVISNDSIEGTRDYARCADINGLHPYPPALKNKRANNLASMVSVVETAVSFFRDLPHKQTIAYLHQGFNYGDYGAVNQRIPSYLEYRNQDLAALICGANGFIQFDRMILHYPELYIGMPNLTREFAYLGKVALAPFAKEMPRASVDKMKMMLKEVDGELFLMACNAGMEPRKVTITIPKIGQKNKVLNVVSEGRTVALDGDVFVDNFDTWEVHVYTTSQEKPDLLTVQEICRQIDEANQKRRKPGNLAFQMFEGNGVVVRASTSEGGKYQRPDNALWHVVDGIVDTGEDPYKVLVWRDTTANESPDWLEIQLPQEYDINKVVVYPFKKTLKDYSVQAFVGGAWKDVDKVSGRNEDCITHEFETVRTDKIRVWITATSGPNAKITEVEVYKK